MRWMSLHFKYLAIGLALAAPLLGAWDDGLGAHPAAVAEQGPALWKAQRDGTTIHLFGTHHFARKPNDWFKHRIQAALEQSDLVITECRDAVDPSDPKLLAAKAKIEAAAASDLELYLGRRQWITLSKTLGKDVHANRTTPPVIILSLIETKADLASGSTAQRNPDDLIRDRADQLRIRQIGLETPVEFLELVATVTFLDQMRMLRVRLDEIETHGLLASPLGERWFAGDVEALTQALTMVQEQTGSFHGVMLEQRNHQFAQGIMQATTQAQAIFVAVGVLHLVGPQSVPSLLAEAGFDVELVAD